MDPLLEAKITNIMSELLSEADKPTYDLSALQLLMYQAVNTLRLSLTHIGYLESKLESTLQSNAMMVTRLENTLAENQRLSQIARY
jgi:hypothetical protein